MGGSAGRAQVRKSSNRSHELTGDLANTGYDEGMAYITEHLTSLRQEITDLRNLNARLKESGGHTAVDQTALELRTTRLREIKQELSQMLNRPEDPKVWWERSRRGNLPA